MKSVTVVYRGYNGWWCVAVGVSDVEELGIRAAYLMEQTLPICLGSQGRLICCKFCLHCEVRFIARVVDGSAECWHPPLDLPTGAVPVLLINIPIGHGAAEVAVPACQ